MHFFSFISQLVNLIMDSHSWYEVEMVKPASPLKEMNIMRIDQKRNRRNDRYCHYCHLGAAPHRSLLSAAAQLSQFFHSVPRSDAHPLDKRRAAHPIPHTALSPHPSLWVSLPIPVLYHNTVDLSQINVNTSAKIQTSSHRTVSNKYYPLS